MNRIIPASEVRRPVVNRSWMTRGIDSIVESLSPRMALERAKARTMLACQAAMPSMDRKRASQTPYNPNSMRNQRDRITLMFEARELAENVGFVKGHLRKVQLYGAGTLAYEPDTGDVGMDSEITDFLDEWSQAAHIGLEHTFTRLIQLAMIGMTRDGDSLLVWVRDWDGSLRLQLCEADQIGELFTITNRPDYCSGILRNPDGGRAGFKVYDRVGEMQYANPQIIEPWNAHFFYDPMRMSARGLTAYDTAIENIRDKFEILGYEKIIVKDVSAGPSVVTYTTRGAADEFDFDETIIDPTTGQVSIIKHAGSGTREYMGQGEQFQAVESKRPGATFQGFLKMLDTENCQGLNLPYGFIIDPSEPGGVAARIIAHVANREFERLQNDVLRPILNSIRDIVLADAIERGVISGHPNFRRGLWMFPPPPTADIQRESDISIREVRAGLSTFTHEFGTYGQNRKRQWEIKKMEAIDRHRLADEATKALQAMGIDSVVTPDEIAAMSDNPANNPNDDGQIAADASKAAVASVDTAPPSNG